MNTDAPRRVGARTSTGRGHDAARHTSGRRHQNRRFAVLSVVIALAIGTLLVRLAFVQVLDGARYASYAKAEVDQHVALAAARGSIYDRDGDLLAISVTRYDVIADDFLMSAPNATAAKLAPILKVKASKLRSELSEKNGYVVLAREVSASVKAELAAFGLPGLSFATDMVRRSPGDALFQPVLGDVNTAGVGYSGIEHEFDLTLRGTAGSAVVAEAPSGFELPGGSHEVVEPKQGASIVLSLDEPLQLEVTSDVTEEMQTTRAHSGIAVVEDVHTGAILAMVDLVRDAKGRIVPATENLALTSVYQPGSVMKLATIGFSLQDGLIAPDTELSVPYSLSVGGYTFYDADYHPTIDMPVSEILAQSSNIGTIKISRLLGMKRLAGALSTLGFGHLTGLDWPGESAGIVPSESTWYGSTAASIPIGTGEAVTPMQVLDAYNAVANGGLFVTPKLVLGTVRNGSEVLTKASAIHRVLDRSTVSELVPMLEGVVQDGTAVAAHVPGYTVAGKTGTAQVPDANGLGYVPGDWNASFVGFVPAEDPQLSGIVVLNHPWPDYYGGSVSAPVFAKIMRYALRHFDIAPPTTTGGAAPAGAEK